MCTDMIIMIIIIMIINHDNNHHDNQDTDGDVLYVWTTLNLRAEHGIGNLYNQTYVLGTMIMILKCHHVVIRSSMIIYVKMMIRCNKEGIVPNSLR